MDVLEVIKPVRHADSIQQYFWKCPVPQKGSQKNKPAAKFK